MEFEEIKQMTCPYEKYACGLTDTQIALDLGQTVTLELDRFFDLVDTCHYTLFAIDRPTDEELGEYNRKHLQIYIKSFNGVEIYVSNATEESEIDYIK